MITFGRCPVRNPGRGEEIRECPRLETERASLGRIPLIMGDPPRTGDVKRDGGARQSPWAECLRPIEEQISLSLNSTRGILMILFHVPYCFR